MTDQDRLVAGRYRLSQQLGRGGMGTVWLAGDALLGRQVAVKKLHVPPQLEDDERARLYERTRREARSAARISHTGVIVVHDVVEDEGLPCIVMEYVPSRSLSDVLREEGPLAPEAAARAGLAMAAALRAAHAAGVLHRDVKPANVLLSENAGRIVLTDFGIAAASGTATLTRTGEFVGSIDYAAPERMQGGESGEAADAWALGATLYEAVEGVPPFRRATWVETAYATASEPPRPMERAGGLAELIERLLEKDPGTRLTLEQAEEWLSGAAGTASLPAPRKGTQAGPSTRPSARSSTLPAPRPPGRRGRRAVVWAACAVIAVGVLAGGAWWLKQADDGAGAGPSGSTKPSAAASHGPSGTPSSRPPVAAGFHRVKDRLGFSVDVPDGWTRQQKPNGDEVDYLAPSGRAGLKFSVLDFAGVSPLRHWRELEPEVREKSPGYDRLRMNATRYQGQAAAIWEYTWQGRVRPYHAVDLGFGAEGERHYALYLSAPDAGWGQSRKYFDTAVNSFRVSARS